MCLWYIILTVLSVIIVPNYAGPGYQLQEMPDHPGLFYERLPDLKITTTTWKIISYIDIRSLLDYEPWTPSYIYQLVDGCHSHLPFDQCESYIGSMRLAGRREKFTNLKKEILAVISAPPEPPSTPRRRGAPFAFIGTISHALFGTISENEANLYENRIEQLEKDKGDLAHLMENATHIIRGAVNDLGEHLQAAETNIEKIRNATTTLRAALRREQTELIRLDYALNLFAFAKLLQDTADIYIRKLESLHDAVLDARRGLIHPSLMSEEQLKTMANHVKGNTSLEFPTSLTGIRHGDISAISHLTMKYHNNLLLISLTVPLLESSSFQFYRLYPCFRPQTDSRIPQGTAYVQPDQPYLTWSHERNKFFSFDEEYLRKCSHLTNFYVCPMRTALHDALTGETCEAQLLLSPTTTVLKKCDVRITRNPRPQWTYLENTHGWLFSLVDPETMHIQCREGLTTVVLQKTGVLQLDAGCTAYSARVTLPATTTISSSIYAVSHPPTALNISELLPNITDATEILAPLLLTEPATPLDGRIHKADVSLQAAESHLRALAKINTIPWYHKAKTWTFGGIGLSVATITGLLVYVLRNNLFSTLITCGTRSCRRHRRPQIRLEDIGLPPAMLPPALPPQPPRIVTITEREPRRPEISLIT